MLVLFVLSSFVIIGMVAVVIDVAWFWTNQQQMQRAADAGALAGAVYLPGDRTSAYAAARAEATKNGYTSGVGAVTVTPEQDSGNSRRLRVTISGPVDAYFAKVFCAIADCTEQATARVVGLAEFVLPVPMGSPQNYFGVGYLVDATSSVAYGNGTNTRAPSAIVSGGAWSSAGSVYTDNNSYGTASNNNSAQIWNGFGFDLPSNATAVSAIQVLLNDLFVSGTPSSSTCKVKVEMTWNSGTTWTTAVNTSNLNTTST
ncbi:MAG: pilus assembly protein TadG-related protein, partial [Mycobacterium sp.]